MASPEKRGWAARATGKARPRAGPASKSGVPVAPRATGWRRAGTSVEEPRQRLADPAAAPSRKRRPPPLDGRGHRQRRRARAATACLPSAAGPMASKTGTPQRDGRSSDVEPGFAAPDGAWRPGKKPGAPPGREAVCPRGRLSDVAPCPASAARRQCASSAPLRWGQIKQIEIQTVQRRPCISKICGPPPHVTLGRIGRTSAGPHVRNHRRR